MEYTCCNLVEKDCKDCPKRPPKWKHLWDAPDGTYQRRCESCGFAHLFINGHDAQYKFCPQCGERK